MDGPANHNWPEREEVARGIGRFFVRALEGGHCGNSGRDRIALPSRLYVVIRNRAGLVTTNPVRVIYRFSEVKLLCAQEGDFGDSIFCGFPSLRCERPVALWRLLASLGLKDIDIDGLS